MLRGKTRGVAAVQPGPQGDEYSPTTSGKKAAEKDLCRQAGFVGQKPPSAPLGIVCFFSPNVWQQVQGDHSLGVRK